MRKLLITIAVAACVLLVLSSGCDKEKIVESTQYVHDIQYVESPPDTVTLLDTIFRTDTVRINGKDTVRIHDTVRVTNTIHDTVVTIRYHYDTVTVVDTVTVTKTQCSPSVPLALAAMESKADTMVINYIYSETGVSSGWVFYLSPEQMEITQVSTKVWDIYLYIDFWAEDFSGYYTLEAYWRMTYNSGDPAVATNWTMSEPPSSVAGHVGGFRVVKSVGSVTPIDRTK